MKNDFMAREMTMEVIVGAFVVMVFLGLFYFTIILSREAWFGTKENVEVVFSNVMGLREGDSVVVRGMRVGKVKNMFLKPDGVHVVAAMEEAGHLHVKKDHKITIMTTSVLGGRHLQIQEGSDQAEVIPQGTVLQGEQPYDLMEDAAAIVNAVKKGVVEGGAAENLQQASQGVNEIVTRLKEGKGTLGRLLSEDDTLYRDLAATVSSVKTLMAGIEKGEGFLGRLAKDEKFSLLIQKTVTDIGAAIDDIRETSPISTFTSIFFGAF